MATVNALDDPSRIDTLRHIIKKKRSLKLFYEEIYLGYACCLERCPPGTALELGSGGGFVKEVIPRMVTSDILPYEGLDTVVDATALPFPDDTLALICMLNVFHHIPNVPRFLDEARRCLVRGGRILMIDQHPGWISTPILKYCHHESFDPRARDWTFESSGPLSGANGSLAWIVFQRDYQTFQALFPNLILQRYEPCYPLRYWLIGGLKSWTLMPPLLYRPIAFLEHFLLRLSRRFGSFVEIELVKQC